MDIEALAASSRTVDDVIADWNQDPEMRAEMQARDAVRKHGKVEVMIRNVIVRGPLRTSKAKWEKSRGSGFIEQFDNLDDARQFAEDHKWFFNNCKVRVWYVAGYEVRTELVPKYTGGPNAPMVERDVTYTVWREVPDWETGEPDRHTRENIHIPHIRDLPKQ